MCWYYEFTNCHCESAKPTEYSIDVKKTDSILTPFLGIIRFKYGFACEARNVVPRGLNWNEANFKAIAPSCLDKPYEECVKVGKPAPKLLGSACTGGPTRTLHFSDTLVLTYRWSHGKWQFEKKESAAPTSPVQ
jgi:hypothetical protein